MLTSIYITDTEFQFIFKELNYEACDSRQRDDLLRRAVGDFESDMSEKFVVPLRPKTGGAYTSCAEHAKSRVYAAMKAKVKELIGFDQNRNLTGTLETTEKFLNVHGIEYSSIKKSLLNHRIDYGFSLLDYADDAQVPVQKLRLSRAYNGESTEADD